MRNFLAILTRSGFCADSIPALRLYLHCLASPVLRPLAIASRLKFSPDLLDSLRAADLPAGEKGRLFSGAMNLFRSGPTYKTTGAGRTPLTDAEILRATAPDGVILETGVSDGISALGLLAARGPAGVLLSDRQAGFHYLDRGPLRLFYCGTDDFLYAKFLFLFFCLGVKAGPPPEGAGRIALLNPAVEASYPGADLIPFDIFTSVLEKPVSSIKCANVLNSEYFSAAGIKRAVANLLRSLAPNGRLFISQNNPRYPSGEAFLALRRDGDLLILEKEANGHELLQIIGSPLFSGLVSGAPEPGTGPATARADGHIASFYRRLAGEHPGEGALQFIRNLGWIGASFAAAKAISTVISIAAARLLGPEEFGKVNVLVSAGAVLAPFMIVGLNNSVMKYGARPQDRPAVFGSSLAVYLSLAVSVSAAVFIFRAPLAAFLKVPPALLSLSLMYALASAAFMLSSAMQQAAGNFSKRGAGEILFSVLLAAGFCAGLWVAGRSHQAMALAYAAAFGGAALFLFYGTGTFRGGLLGKEKFLEMARHGGYFFGSGIGGWLLLNVQGLVINAYLSPAETGRYAAYYIATISSAAYLGYAIGSVLFPKAAASTNRERLWELAARSWARLSPAAFIFFLFVQAAVLTLAGRHQYGMQPGLMILFALCGTLMLAYSSLAQIVFSEGIRAARLSLSQALAGGAVNLSGCLLLVPRFGPGGAAAAFLLSYTLLLAWLCLVRRRYM